MDVRREALQHLTAARPAPAPTAGPTGPRFGAGDLFVAVVARQASAHAAAPAGARAASSGARSGGDGASASAAGSTSASAASTSTPQSEAAGWTASGQSRNSATLITGANGEFGHGLIRALHERGVRDIVAIDLRELDAELRPLCRDVFAGDIIDGNLLDRLAAIYEVNTIYHLAALLSTRSEFVPETAFNVNVGGTVNLLNLAATQAASHGGVVKFLFPSSIAVYGLPDLKTKKAAGRIDESQFLEPSTMYGCNKLACEHLGRYYARHYRQLAKDHAAGDRPRVDFRSIRFPGVISAFTLPSGGTSDYAPEMIHAAAKGEPYRCFVREDAQIPFITMPDAIEALTRLGNADAASLTRTVYNISSFAPTAGAIAELVRRSFPGADITFVPDIARQGIVDSWPTDVDDAAARRDWGFRPEHNFESAFRDYLIPNITRHYATAGVAR